MTALALRRTASSRSQASAIDTTAAWIAWLAASPQTTRTARCGDLRAFGAFLSTAAVHVADPSNPREIAVLLAGICHAEALALSAAWIDCMRVQQLAETTIARRISTIGSWWRLLGQFGLQWQVRLPRPTIKPYQFRACSWASIVAVTAELRTAERWRELLPIELLACLGLRRAEACGIRVTDVLRERPAIRVLRKGGYLRILTIPASMLETIDLALDGRTRGPLLVSSIGRNLTPSGLFAITHRLGLGTPHGLRHAGATELYRVTHDAALVRAWLDHVHLDSTQVYVEVLEDLAGKATQILAT